MNMPSPNCELASCGPTATPPVEAPTDYRGAASTAPEKEPVEALVLAVQPHQHVGLTREWGGIPDGL
ncbi:MAG: hypothetical protein EON59_11025 [Alphaproteobacteria bacterium]|nr:MAG: hypothetical protein EON59_11025 [Alphaproteobacteria bacterium]